MARTGKWNYYALYNFYNCYHTLSKYIVGKMSEKQIQEMVEKVDVDHEG